MCVFLSVLASRGPTGKRRDLNLKWTARDDKDDINQSHKPWAAEEGEEQQQQKQ